MYVAYVITAVFVSAPWVIWAVLLARRLERACYNVVAGIALPPVDDLRWTRGFDYDFPEGVVLPSLHLGAITVLDAGRGWGGRGSHRGSVRVDDCIVHGPNDRRAVAYANAVWRSYRRRHALESIENASIPPRLGSEET